ncbi:unnamed protein product [Symbiodinium necroappetens]|uniref:Uncharacterized protein n=1 Tax=Symbiodinium necroappetens TaxID=1628268 RepID=A0A812T900_9DINO|nr:unnamed protein product [Symbiodinium necroappetens]
MAPKRGYTTNEENTPDIVQEEKPSSSDATKNEENTEKPSSSDVTKKQEITEKPSSSDATKKQEITEKPSSSDATKSINGMTKIEKEQSQEDKIQFDALDVKEALKTCAELFNQMNPLAQKRDYLLNKHKLKNKPVKKETSSSSTTSLNLRAVLRGTTEQKDITGITIDMIYSKLKTKATDLLTMNETQKKNAVLFINNEQIASPGSTRLHSDKFVTQNKEGKKTRVILRSGDVLSLVLRLCSQVPYL